MVILPWCAGLSRRPRHHERSSPDTHEPGRERAAATVAAGQFSMPGSAVRQPGAGIFQPNRAVGVRRHGHHGQAAVVQHATDTDGPAQIMRIGRRRIIRSVAKLARTRRSLRRAAAHTTKGMTAQ
jgi:hypothetical protein